MGFDEWVCPRTATLHSIHIYLEQHAKAEKYTKQSLKLFMKLSHFTAKKGRDVQHKGPFINNVRTNCGRGGHTGENKWEQGGLDFENVRKHIPNFFLN